MNFKRDTIIGSIAKNILTLSVLGLWHHGEEKDISPMQAETYWTKIVSNNPLLLLGASQLGFRLCLFLCLSNTWCLTDVWIECEYFMNDGYCFLKNRLWEHLVQKEREYQNLLRLTLEQKTQELHHLQLQYKSNGESFSLCFDIGVKEGQKIWLIPWRNG